MSLIGGRKCPKGEILRKAYTRKDGTRVKASCVKDRGLPGKTPKSKKVLPKLKEGLLEKYGYKLSKSFEKRKVALRKAMKNEGNVPVLRRVVVLRTYNKNEPKLFKKLNRDVEFIQEVRAKQKLVAKKVTKKKKRVRFRL